MRQPEDSSSKAYPNSAAQWQAILAAAPADIRPPSHAQEAAIETRSVVVHSGGMTAVRAALQARRRGQRGPQKAPTKKLVSLRLSPEVLSYFRGTGEGWQSRIDKALRKAAGV